MAEKVLAAMSGGVDSSAAVKLLQAEGYELAGATMHLYDNEDIGIDKGKTCCSLSDVEDARLVALKLGIDFYVFNFSEEFRHCVIDDFIDTYMQGGTPNPCIRCNRYLKFEKFLQRSQLMGFDHIATGHYAIREFDGGRWLLKRAADRAKDQSYVLYSMTQYQLAHTLLPVGGLTKPQIRELAESSGLVNAAKPDSQDICFIPDGDYAKFITENGGALPEGDIVLDDGTVLGRHRGLIHYTVGQRRGVGVSYSEPLFVTAKDMANNRLIMGTAEKLYANELVAGDLNFIAFDRLESPFKCTAQTRYHQQDVPCTLYPEDGGRVRVVFDKPHKAISKGQAVVFYDGEYVVGGGTIL